MTFMLTVLLACAPVRHPVEAWAPPAASSTTWDAVLSAPPIVQVDTFVTGSWQVAAGGLINLHNARAADLPRGQMPVLVMAHTVRHPLAGTWLVDTGVVYDGRYIAGMRGLNRLVLVFGDRMDIRGFLQGVDLAGVFLTHLHIDHVLGLPAVPPGTPIMVGPGEAASDQPLLAPLRGYYQRLYADRPAFRELDPAAARPMPPFSKAWDLFGDGSFWAVHLPGHTPGSLAFVANAVGGPLLLTGDSCHTVWGWENEVEPGRYSADQEANRVALLQLRAFAAAHPEVRVVLGHQQK